MLFFFFCFLSLVSSFFFLLFSFANVLSSCVAAAPPTAAARFCWRCLLSPTLLHAHCQHLVNNNTWWTPSSSPPRLLIFIQKYVMQSHSFSVPFSVCFSHPLVLFFFCLHPFPPGSTMQSWESTMPPPVSQWPFRERAIGQCIQAGEGPGVVFRQNMDL